MSYSFDANDKREMNKVSLEHFPFNHNNEFDPAINQLLIRLREQFQRNSKRFNEKASQLKRPGVPIENEVITPGELDIYTEQIESLLDYSSTYQELLAISEMQIVYAFKHLEIGLKTIISATYPSINSRSFYRWDRMMDFLKSIGVNPNHADSYTQADELRVVNNNIKHSKHPDKEMDRILEFKGKSEIHPLDLNAFYNRVQPNLKHFLESIADSIYKERYVFDDEKIKRIASDLHQRMGRNDAEKFVVELMKLYN